MMKPPPLPKPKPKGKRPVWNEARQARPSTASTYWWARGVRIAPPRYRVSGECHGTNIGEAAQSFSVLYPGYRMTEAYRVTVGERAEWELATS